MDELQSALRNGIMGQTKRVEVGATLPSFGLARVKLPQSMARGFVVTLGSPNRAIRNTGVGAPSAEMSVGIGGAFATVGWGVAGFQQTVEIDWRQGGTYYFYGSFVEVSVTVPTAIPVMNTGQPNASFARFGASISPAEGQASSFDHVTRTVEYPSIPMGGGNIEDRPVPRFASTCHLLLRPTADTFEFTAQWLTVVAGAFVVQQTTKFQATASRNRGDVTQPMIVPPAAVALRLQNNSSAVALDVPLAIYRLSL